MSKPTPGSDDKGSWRALETPLESACHLLYLARHADAKPEDREQHIHRAEHHLQEMARVIKRNCD